MKQRLSQIAEDLVIIPFLLVAGGLAYVLWLASTVPLPSEPTTNDEIKTMLLETQRNQAQLAAMLLYTEDNLKTEIKRLERKPPLLPEVR